MVNAPVKGSITAAEYGTTLPPSCQVSFSLKKNFFRLLNTNKQQPSSNSSIVFYVFTADTLGTYLFSVCDDDLTPMSTFLGFVSLYQGDCSSLSCTPHSQLNCGEAAGFFFLLFFSKVLNTHKKQHTNKKGCHIFL